jgi:two-component system, NarL family, response regulator YdfI
VIRVFIVAGSPLARAGLENLLSARGVRVVGSAADTSSFTGLLSDVQTDVILVDATDEQPEAVLHTLTEADLASDAAVVILAENATPRWAADALRAGIRGVLPSDIAPEQLVAALEAAAAGLVVIHPTDVGQALPAAAPASQPLAELAEPLTRREREVLQMLASGLGNKEIAARLNISDHTAKFHVASILGKLGAGSRTEAVALGIRRGLVLL